MNDEPDVTVPTDKKSGLISFDAKSIIRNPITWVALGVGLTLFLQHQAETRRSKTLGGSRPMRNVTPGQED